MTLDKWIVLAVAVCAIVALNVNFIRRMNRRDRASRDERGATPDAGSRDDQGRKE